MNRLLILSLSTLVALAATKVSYDGYEVWRVTLESEHGVKAFRTVIEDFNLDVLSSSRSSVDVLIKPQMLRVMRTTLARLHLQKETLIPDFGVLVRAEEERLASKDDGFSLDDYNTFEDIEKYLKDVASKKSFVSLSSIGQTDEKRDLWQMKISVGEGKPAVWVDCNIHAREWITGSTCLYGINLLTESYGTNPNVTALLDNYDVYIIPIFNPDGYFYTWDTDRTWRKNRRKYIVNYCHGVDLNRNFDINFGGIGSSPNSCSEIYRGPRPASELETKAAQEAILDMMAHADLKILYSIHSYSQLWLYPYGYTSDLPPNADELERLSQIGIKALEAVNGTHYVSGPIYDTIYAVSGSTIDYSYAQGVLYSFTLELRDTGEHGFILPADQITPTGEETWAGLIASILAV